MDNGHTLSAWPPHSYENIYFLQERYESVVMSSQMVDQTRFLPALHHKAEFAYECLILSIEGMVCGSLKICSNVMGDEKSFRGTCGRLYGVVKKVVNG
jgi:hypothetical protein